MLAPHKAFAQMIKGHIEDTGGKEFEPGFLTIRIEIFSTAKFCCLPRYLYTGKIERTVHAAHFAAAHNPATVVIQDATSGRTKDCAIWNPLDSNSAWQFKEVTWTELLDLNVAEILFEVGCYYEKIKKAALEFLINNTKTLFADGKDPFEDYQDRKECHAFMVEVIRSKSNEL
ncbi:hypothetical protein BGX28_004643 [Mortierella sp. GBA30]|nr:hypothetical protein BGX28_004643 [Mortierella sp. GBA30]